MHSIYHFLSIVLLTISISNCAQPLKSTQTSPIADVHLHYNWDQQEVIQPEEVLEHLRIENVALGVVSSVPTDYALMLKDISKDIHLVSLFSPYLTTTHRYTWFRDPAVVEYARSGLETQQYSGIGELHLWSNYLPRPNNEILLGLFALAEAYNVPFLLHTETADEKYMLTICQQHTDVRILWAHAGGMLEPDAVQQVMQWCPNVWIELSARDPWRYHALTDHHGKLLTAWRRLIIQFSDRIMVGTDPVWSVTKAQDWDSADEGWDHYHQLIQFHRHWLSKLPSDVEKKVRLCNAFDFFNVKHPCS